jgi:hypothetical protein
MKGTASESYEANDNLVERVHDCLAQALHRTRPGSGDSPVTVAEIYQDLVPYRSIRSTIGFQMNADYEHTLLRLLSGEGGYARLEPSEARDELRSELESPNPNVGLFRKFAACDVWVTPPLRPPEDEDQIADVEPNGRGPEAKPATDFPQAASPPGQTTGRAESGESASSTAENPLQEDDWQVEDVPWSEAEPELWNDAQPELLLEEEVEAADPVGESARQSEPVTAEPGPATGASPMYEPKSSPTATTMSATHPCAFCSAAMPTGRLVRFCPFCGMDQSMAPCANCQEPLDSAWKYCIACGTTQS